MDQIIVSVWDECPSVRHRPPQFNSSVPHKDHNFSAPKIPQFHTKNPSGPPPPLSSTSKIPQFNTKTPSVPHQKPLSFTQNPSVPNTRFQFWCGTEECVKLRGMLNWGVFGVELRGDGTEGFLMLNRGVFGVELKSFWCRAEGFWVLKRCGPCVKPMCWTDGVCLEPMCWTDGHSQWVIDTEGPL